MIGRNIRINSLKLHEFMGATGELFVDFSDATEFIGKNGAGKTLILNALSFVFCGTDCSGKKRNFVSNTANKEAFTYVECNCNIDGEDILLRRLIKVDKAGKTTNGIWKNHSEVKQTEWNKEMDKDLFLSIINPAYLASLKPSDLKKVLLKFLKEKGIDSNEIFKEVFDEIDAENFDDFENILDIFEEAGNSIDEAAEYVADCLTKAKANVKAVKDRIKEIEAMEPIEGACPEYVIGSNFYESETDAFESIIEAIVTDPSAKNIENLKFFTNLKATKAIQDNNRKEYEKILEEELNLKTSLPDLIEIEKKCKDDLKYMEAFNEKILENLNLKALPDMDIKFKDKYDKTDFNVFYKDVPLEDCSFAEKVTASIILSNHIMDLINIDYPIFVDNAECITELPLLSKPRQIVTLAVAKDIELSRFVGDLIENLKTLETMPRIDLSSSVINRIIGTAFDISE